MQLKPVRHRLTITIPGAEKPQSSYWPDEFSARAHLQKRLEGIPGIPVGFPPLPPGAQWVLVALVEQEITKGTVP